ncbi:MAG: HAD hydrolase-like protein [Solirubrobacteraceae bacterium]
MALADAAGFMLDLDGTLVQRGRDGVVVLPGAAELIDAIRASGRPLVVFTNASHADPGRIAKGLREAGLGLEDQEVLSAGCSALAHLQRRYRDARVLVLGTQAARRRFAAGGVEVLEPADAASAEVVLTLHVDDVGLTVLEAAARAVLAGAAFLTANYVRAYAGLDGPIISRGAMAAAAIAKAAGQRPIVVGKPSRAAVRAVAERLELEPRSVAFIGDDAAMDVALGRLAGGWTVLVRSGIGARAQAARLPEAHRPDLVVDGVGDLLEML